MFDIGLWEILVVVVVALLVIKPEQLPHVARTIGRLLGKVKSMLASVKQEVDKHCLELDDIEQSKEKPGK